MGGVIEECRMGRGDEEGQHKSPVTDMHCE